MPFVTPSKSRLSTFAKKPPMTHSISLRHAEDMHFVTEVNGHTLHLDADAEVGGLNAGPRPKPLILVALAGCTGMDVASLLTKMRVDHKNLVVDVEADLTDEHPKTYHTFRVKYSLNAAETNREKIEKAINLSKDRYCGVSALLGKGAEIHYKLDILPL